MGYQSNRQNKRQNSKKEEKEYRRKICEKNELRKSQFHSGSSGLYWLAGHLEVVFISSQIPYLTFLASSPGTIKLAPGHSLHVILEIHIFSILKDSRKESKAM